MKKDVTKKKIPVRILKWVDDIFHPLKGMPVLDFNDIYDQGIL